MTTPEPERHASIPCSATTNAGKPCRSWATEGGKCRLHGMTPEQRRENGQRAAKVTNALATRRKAAQAEAKVEGALAALPAMGFPVAISTESDVVDTLTSAIKALLADQLPASKAKALATLVKIRLDAGALAVSAKLAELERRLADQQPSGFSRRK